MLFNMLASFGKNPGTPVPPSNPSLIVGANNLLFPHTYNTEANWVHNSVTTHTTGANSLVNPIFVFVNGLIIQNGNTNAYYDFTLRAGLKVGSTYYPLYVRGTGSTRDTSVSKNWGYAIVEAAGLTIPPFTRFRVYSRRVANDAGAAGTYNVITAQSGIRARQDGIVAGTNPAIDYTLGGYGEGAAGLLTSVGGIVTSGAVSSAGVNYTSTPSLSGWFGPAEQGQPGAQYQSAPVSFVSGVSNTNPVVVTTRRPHALS